MDRIIGGAQIFTPLFDPSSAAGGYLKCCILYERSNTSHLRLITNLPVIGNGPFNCTRCQTVLFKLQQSQPQGDCRLGVKGAEEKYQIGHFPGLIIIVTMPTAIDN